jgi:hypothetical protein
VKMMRQNQNLTNLLGWLMVMIFTFAHTPLANAVIFTAAAWSGEHEIIVQNTGEKVTIVLHHQGQINQHSAVTKALLYLTNVTEDGKKDHVLGCTFTPNFSVQISAKFADPKLNSLADRPLPETEPTVFKIGTFATTLRIARPPPPEVIVSDASTLGCLATIVLVV